MLCHTLPLEPASASPACLLQFTLCNNMAPLPTRAMAEEMEELQ